MIPPEKISQRAVECKSYARALYYWEQHIRHVRDTDKNPDTSTALLEHLQDIYTQIDEPDGMEGISAHLHVLDIDQQILGHRKAGRWTAAQSWYEIKLAEDPEDVDVQLNLLTCLKESGQHGGSVLSTSSLLVTDSFCQTSCSTMSKACTLLNRQSPSFSHSQQKLRGQQVDGLR
jgi:hypothetical protein